MPSKQRTFELVDTPKTIRPMTSKQAKKAYQKANRTPRISKAEQKRRDAEELAKHRKAHEKEQAAAKAKAVRDKKAAKALEQKEQRKRLGMPEPSRHVRASQSRISMFIKQGNKRLREPGNTGEESEDTMCDDLDEKPPAKRIAHEYTEEEGETLSKPIAPDELMYQAEPPMKHHVKKNFNDERTLVKPVVSDGSDDEFGDFPPLSDNDISFLDIRSMHSTPVNATSGWPGLTGLVRSTFREPVISSNGKQEQELPRMKNLEREQMSLDDPLQLEDMLDSQIRSEAAYAACRSDDNQAVSFEKEQSYKGDTRSTTSTLNHPIKDILGERELLWHAHIHRRHDLSTQSTNPEPPVSLYQASAAKVSHDKQNVNGVPLPGTCSRSVSKSSAIALALPRKSIYNGSTESSRSSVSASDRALSLVSGSDKQISQEGRFDSSSSRSQYFEAQNAKCSVPTCLKEQGYSPRKSPVETSRSASDARPALQEKSPNMGPPALPQKIKSSMPFAAPLGPQLTVNNINLPPSSTQAFLESHLDEFFPSPTQEARELYEDPILPQSSTNLKTNFANSKLHKKLGDANDSDLKDVEDDFGVMLSTQELNFFSQDWESVNSPPRQEGVEKKKDSNKKIGVVSEAIGNLISSQDSLFSSQEFAGLEPVSKAKSPTTKSSHSPQIQASKVHLNHHSSQKSQIRLTQPLNTRTPQINPDTDLTPKPRRSPWFKEKPEDKHIKKRFFTEKPEDLEAAASLESKKAWEEIKEATSSNRHNFDDDYEPEGDDQLQAALAESKEWDEVYKAVVPTPTPRRSGKRGRQWMDVEEKENQTPSRIMKQTQASATKKETKFEYANSDSSTDYGDGDDSDWDKVLDGL
ncbi:hypothetical protein EYC80_009376 [Monilinia laxa]|uniref:Uncharacterized protein n=1 Tax=Monilinia laxa TaxID=61186 RepID=A0A5N6JY22_MONLA|nr:hypothetical protein EYC80_009376 [Monilinia laxa]